MYISVTACGLEVIPNNSSLDAAYIEVIPITELTNPEAQRSLAFGDEVIRNFIPQTDRPTLERI